DAATGEPVWTAALPGANHVTVDGMRVIGAGRGIITALDRMRGTALWQMKLPAEKFATQPVAIEGVVLVAEDRGKLLALVEETGGRVHIGEEYARVEHIYPDLQVELALYRCTLLDGDEPKPIQCEKVAWVARRDLPGLPFCEADIPILVRLAEEELAQS